MASTRNDRVGSWVDIFIYCVLAPIALGCVVLDVVHRSSRDGELGASLTVAGFEVREQGDVTILTRDGVVGAGTSVDAALKSWASSASEGLPSAIADEGGDQ